MAFIPVANGVELVIDFVNAVGDTNKVVLGIALDVPGTLSTLFDLTKAVIDFFGASTVRPWVSSASLAAVKATALDSDSAPTVTNTAGGDVSTLPIAGTIAGGGTGSQVAALVTTQTGFRGRSFRGRNYWPCVPLSYLASPDALTDTAVAAWNTLVDDFIVAMNINATPLQVISRHHDHAPRTSGVMTPILHGRAEHKLGTQRRRVGGTFGH